MYKLVIFYEFKRKECIFFKTKQEALHMKKYAVVGTDRCVIKKRNKGAK